MLPVIVSLANVIEEIPRTPIEAGAYDALDSGFLDRLEPDPVDQQLRPSATAFVLGALVGVRVISGLVPPEVYNRIPQVESISELLDLEPQSAEGRELARQMIIEAGYESFSRVDYYDQLLADWAAACTERPEHYAPFVTGFGFVVEAGIEAWEDPTYNVDTRLGGLLGTDNWDEALIDLLDEDKNQ